MLATSMQQKDKSAKSHKTEANSPRPPIVAVMGHVDHGKTSLLDYIRKEAVAKGEAGGITQKVSAYEIERKTADGKGVSITFLDTPGHEAFAGIRSRGAKIADIAILIVSGEDGVKPQTVEAYEFITANKIPFIIAITKTDKPSANVEKVKQGLLEKEIYIEGYGGSVPCIPISSLTGEGVPELLDMISLVAEMEEISGNESRPAEGFVLESGKTKQNGIASTLIIKEGKLRQGMFVVAENAVSTLRAIEDFSGKRIDTAGPGRAVNTLGWNAIPNVGSPFKTFDNKKMAENYIEELSAKKNSIKTAKKNSNGSFSGERVSSSFIIKANSSGALEAIRHELQKLGNEKIFPKIIQAGEGDVNESDVKIAMAGKGGYVFGFNVKADAPANRLAEREKINIEIFDIIYKLSERVKEILTLNTPKVEVAKTKGQAKILKVFSVLKNKEILGGKVIDGVINLGDEIKILRRGEAIGKGKIRELQQQKEKTSEVGKDREFGAMIDSVVEIAPGDVIETFVIVKE